MKKTIKQTGNSLGITFNKEECKINDIELGDVVDLLDMVVIKKKKENGK